MHRNYQPVKPATNKLLKKRWDGAAHDRHRDKISQAKCVVDTKSPSTYMHLQYKMKKIQLEEERHAVIDRDNRILLEKMSAIMRTRGRVDNWNDYVPKSLNKHKRTRELIRVTLENQKILARIQAKQPQYSAKKWEEQWMDTKKYMGHIRKYSDDWYQQSQAEKRRISSRISKRGSAFKERQEKRQETAVSTQQYSDEEVELAKPPTAGHPKPAKIAKSAAPVNLPPKAVSPKPPVKLPPKSASPKPPVKLPPKSASPNPPVKLPPKSASPKPPVKLPPKSASPNPPVAVVEKPLTPVVPSIVDEKPPTPKPATPQATETPKPATPQPKPATPQPVEPPKAAIQENPAVVNVPEPEVPDQEVPDLDATDLVNNVIVHVQEV